jgi:hypothetical protein
MLKVKGKRVNSLSFFMVFLPHKKCCGIFAKVDVAGHLWNILIAAPGRLASVTM